VEYLESLSPQIPIVLINRKSDRFSTVSVDSKGVGLKAAQLFQQNGYSEAGIIASTHSYVATGMRTQAFLDACSQLGIHVDKKHIIKEESTITGGVKAAERYCRLKNPPKAVFVETDSMALGASYAFQKAGRQIPSDIKLLAISLLDREVSQYTIPPLSVIQIPQDNVSRESIRTLIKAMKNQDFTPEHIDLEPILYMRESF